MIPSARIQPHLARSGISSALARGDKAEGVAVMVISERRARPRGRGAVAASPRISEEPERCASAEFATAIGKPGCGAKSYRVEWMPHTYERIGNYLFG